MFWFLSLVFVFFLLFLKKLMFFFTSIIPFIRNIFPLKAVWIASLLLKKSFFKIFFFFFSVILPCFAIFSFKINFALQILFCWWIIWITYFNRVLYFYNLFSLSLIKLVNWLSGNISSTFFKSFILL